jgi:hypothetical protein
MSRHLYKDQDGVQRILHFDEDKPYTPTVETVVQMDEIAASIARDREIMWHGVNKVVARIPVTIMERAMHEGWDDDDWRKFLNSAEAIPYRIWPGRV